jgi:glycosyltransferase involved in cell wall biosynthesis
MKVTPERGSCDMSTMDLLTLENVRTEVFPTRSSVASVPMKQRHTVSVVIPALNEAENLPYVLSRIPDWVDEVVLVDGHSTDQTVEVARQVRPDIRIVMQEGRGKGAALRSGFAATTGDLTVMLDADGSTDPAEIVAFVGALLAGADFVKGSRFLQGGGTADMPFYRKLGNWAFVMSVRLLFGGNYSDLLYGYNAFWSRVVPQLNLDADGFEIETLMNVRALRAGLKVAEVPSFEAKRLHGEGRLRAIPDGWRVLKTIVRERLFPQERRAASGAAGIEPGKEEVARMRPVAAHTNDLPDVEVGQAASALQ